jgi:hypothetical protein
LSHTLTHFLGKLGYTWIDSSKLRFTSLNRVYEFNVTLGKTKSKLEGSLFSISKLEIAKNHKHFSPHIHNTHFLSFHVLYFVAIFIWTNLLFCCSVHSVAGAYYVLITHLYITFCECSALMLFLYLHSPKITFFFKKKTQMQIKIIKFTYNQTRY